MAKRSHARRTVNSYKNEGRKSNSSRNKSNKKQNRENENVFELHASSPQITTAYSTQRSKAPLKPQTDAQSHYISAIKSNCLTFGIGPAGTGKSYCAAALAAEALESGKIDRIILTRPAVEAGEQLGFLPGAVDEKFAVYIDAFRDILDERLGSGAVEYNLRHGRIVAAPLAFMRGKTFSNKTFVVLDEAQNTTISQLKMFLTRIGTDCKVVVNGDIKQSDIRGPNGLEDAVIRVKGLPGVYVHQFDRDDIVRSGLVRDLMDRYEVER